MPASESQPAVLELAEEFLARYRAGERPPLSEYTDRHPHLADEIREVFPAMAMMEKIAIADGSLARDPTERVAASNAAPALRQLGDYRILREVGRGGMGIVYEAEQVSLGRHVALKVLPGSWLLNPTFLERFRREAKAAARLHHTNIVPVFGTGEADGTHFYAMQFIRGEGLDKVLNDLRRLRGRPAAGPGEAQTVTVAAHLASGVFAAADTAFDATEPAADVTRSGLSGSRPNSAYYRSVARVGVQVAEALAYSNKQGILHRDIKPSNLLIDLQGTVWVTDFGLAKADGDDLTHTGDIVGTIRYMAPERFDGRSLPQSDVFSLGLTLYEMVAHRPAFEAANRAKMVEQVVHAVPPPLRRADPHVPRDLDTIIRKAIAKDPADRYPTADAFAEDLRRFLSDRPVLARRATPLETAWRWCRRNPAVAGLVTAVAALLVVVAAGSTVATLRLRTALAESEAHRRDAVDARNKTERQRWEATFEQAKANRLSHRPGQRFRTLELLRQCAADGRALDLPAERRAELREAVIATLAMPDLYFEEVTAFATDHRADFDGNLERVALVDARGNCSIRRTADDVETFHIDGPGLITAPVFGHTGRYLVLFRDGGPTDLWVREDETWARRLTLTGVKNVCFDRTDRLVAFSSFDGSLAVYELPSARRKHFLAPEKIGDGLRVDFHPTEPVVVCASYFSTLIQIRDLRTGKVLAWHGGRNPCNPLWHPDGRRLIVPDGEGGRIQDLVWDPATRSLKVWRTLAVEATGIQVELNPAGTRLAAIGWNGIMRLFDYEAGRLLFEAPPAWRSTVPRFSPDGERLAGGVERQGGRLGVWRVGDGLDYRTVFHEPAADAHGLDAAAVHPDGRLLAAGAPYLGVGLWDLATGRRLAFLPQPNTNAVHVAFDRAGALYVTGWDGTFRLPVRPDGADGYAVGPPELLPFGRGHSELAVSPDGRVRAKGYGYGYGEGPYAGVWVQIADRPVPVALDKAANTSCVAVSPDGRWIAGGQQNNSVRIWQVTDGGRPEFVTELPGVGPFCRFSPDGRRLWASLGGGRLYSVGDWSAGPACEGTSCAFSPDGGLLATTRPTGVVVLCDPRTGAELARLEDPNLDLSSPPAFSPDGALLILPCAGKGKGIHVWDLRRIRRVLREMDLDWDAPELPPEPAARPVAHAEFVDPGRARLPANWKPPGSSADPEQWQKEVAAYTVALALQPANPDILVRRGRTLCQLKLNDEAVADLTRALALRPGDVAALHWRGHAYENLGRWAEAEADFSAALAGKPEDPHLLDRRGRCRLQLDRLADGVTDIERSLALRPNQPEVRRFLGTTCNNRAWVMLTGPEDQRDPAAGLVYAEKAVKLFPQEHFFLNTRGVGLYRNRRYPEAVAALDRSLTAGKGQLAAFDLYFLAMAHGKLGHAAEAQDCFDRAEAWVAGQRNLSALHAAELKAFAAEAAGALQPARD
jgi:serine/threonine protein kinase/WD40 repeat protein/tetratricopeptide (TPR) repeat protein